MTLLTQSSNSEPGTKTNFVNASQRIAEALRDRRQPTLEWWLAVNHHRTHHGKPMDFTRHYFQVPILQDKSPDIRIEKSTQCGVSENEIKHALALVDQGRNVFWVFPDENLRNKFVKDRLDPSLHLTEYYAARVREARQRLKKGRQESDDVSLKQIGYAAINLVGSNSVSSFKSFAADDAIIDEVDQCHQGNLMMVPDRFAHSQFRTMWRVGNPTTSGFGIDGLYKASDQKRWRVRCDACGQWQEMDWFKNVVREIEGGQFELRDEAGGVLCTKCDAPLDRLSQGEWVANYPDRTASGYHVSQLFSGSVPIAEMWEAFQRGLANETEMMRFYNSVLGLPYESEGAKLTAAILNRCVDDYPQMSTGVNCYGGIDVGKELHYVVRHESSRVIRVGTARDFEELDNLLEAFPGTWVVDALPETRKAREFANRHSGHVYLCTYVGTDQVKDFKIDPDEMTVKAHRTQSMDDSHASWLRGKSRLFRSAASVPDFYDQMSAPTRIFEKRNENDHGRFVWREGAQADHYRHADNYSYLAMKIEQSVGVPMMEFV